MKVTDDDGGVGQADVSAVIRNVAPAFELGANASVAEGSTFTRAVSFTDPGADSWHADIGYGDGNASNGVVVTAGSPFNVSHAWRNEGVYTLDVGIGDGTTTTHDTALVTVTNVAPTVAAGGAAALAEGGTLTRSGTGSVDWGDGSAVQPLTISARTFDIVHTFTKNGSFTVTVAVADDASAPGQASFGVTVSNVAPVVDAGADASQVEGATFTRTASFTDAGSDTWTATVDWGDGSAVEPATVDGPTKHVSLSHQFRQDGVYSVKVKVLDGDDFGQDTVVVTVTNALPTVGLGSGASFAEGSTFTRGGTFSDPGLDDTFTGTVDWGDGSGTQALTLGSGTFTLSHAWADNGSYTITVKISDDDGTTTTTLFVAVTNVSPTLTAAGPFNVNAGSLWSTNVAFSDPGTGDTWTATVDYKDGAGVVSLGAVSGGTIALAKTYDVPGTYNVAVTVSDDELGSDTKTYVVNVANVAPTVTIVAPGTAGNPLIVNEGSVATINATYTDPGTNTDVATIRWTAAGAFEAATIDTVLHTVTATHTYDDNGAFAPTVRVTDQGSLVGSANATVTVNNVAPVVSAGANAKAIPDRHFTRTVTFTDPGNDSWTATVDWGDGAGPVTASVVGKTVPLDHTFTEDKVFTVVVKVTDDDGGFNSGSFTVDARLFDCTGVSLPAGVALWVGGGSPATAWTTPANWKDGAVPTASQAVAVCNNMTNTPSVNQSASCGSVSLGASATIAVQSGKELTVDGDLTGGAITGPGSVKLVNADAKLATSVVNLTVAGNVTLTDFVTASGNVSLTSGFLSLEGKTLDVGGDLTVAQSASAGLRMKTAGSEVDVAGTLLLTGTGQGSNLTTGAIHARGDFVQSGVGAFMSNGTAVVFDGSVAQTVTLDAATDSNFAAVTLDNTAGLTLNDSIAISGQLTLTHGTLAGADTDIAVDLTGTTLPSVAVAAVYAVAKTEIRGLISLTADYTFGVTKHTLVIREDGALTIGTRTLTLAGDLVHYTAGTAATGLIMSSSSGNVIVAGNTVFDTAAGASTTSNSGLTAGTLHLKGNLTAQDTAGRYAGASHVSPLGSAGTISIEGATDQVHTLTLPSNKGITLTNLTVVGQRTIDLGDALLALLGTFTHTGSAPATIAHCDLHARDALVTYVTFDDCRLTLDATTATTDLDNVTFKNPLTDPGGQLNISNASNSGTRTLNFSTLTFSSIQGNYIEAFQSGLGSLVINVTTSYPLYGTPKTSKTGNVTINWGSTSDDTDGDGLTDSDEWTRGTSPILTDSDGDGWADGFEVERGKNPLLASSTPLTFATTKTLTLLTGSGANKLALANLVTGDSKKEIAIGNATTSTAIVTIVGADASGNLTKIADVARNANQPNATSIASICVGNLVGSTTGTIQPEIFPLDPNPVHSLIDLPTSTWTHEDAPKDPQSNAPNMPGGTDCDIGAIDADQEMVAMVRAFSSTGSSLTLMRWTSGTAFVGGSAGSWTYAAGSAPPQWLRVGDIDGGGRKDVAVGSVYTGSAYEVYLYRSNGAQLTFNPLDAYKTLSYNAEVRGLAIGNIDGDGNSGDIAVVVNETSGNTDSVYVDFRADPGGTYTRVGPIAVCNGARSLSLGDLDQNGKLDIATACETTSTITLVMQKAAGRAFTRYDFKATGIGTPVFVATDDVTGDGKADIVAIDKAANTVNVTTVTP
ncbi:MAG: PKD domain-containing protein [Myxococcota bacterium]